MKTIESLGLAKNWIYEAIISSMGDDGPHAAPFGVKKIDDQRIEMAMYKGSKTLSNIQVKREFAVNMVVDPVVFYHALFVKHKIKFSRAKRIDTPVILGSPASIEARIIKTMDTRRKIIIEAKVVYIHFNRKKEWINRANNLLLESLILSTRMVHFPQGEAEALLRENYRVIRKVALGSEYELAMKELMNRLVLS